METQKVIELRKRQNPLDWFNPIGLQGEIVNEIFEVKSANTIFICGSNRCLRGDSEIYDPVLKISRRIDKIYSNFYVNAWNGKKMVIAKASKPFVKGFENMYRVKLSNGKFFVCSAKHQVLTEHGYRDVSSLRRGSCLFHPETSSGNDLLTHASSGQNCENKAQDSQSGYQSYPHSYGEQLPNELDTSLDEIPSLGGVPAHSSFSNQRQKDDRVYKLVHNRLYQYFDRPSILDVLRQNAGRFADILSRVSYRILQCLSLKPIRIDEQSISESCLRLSNSR